MTNKKPTIEELAMSYHEICRELVNQNQDKMITKPKVPYIEWKDLSDEQKEGRRLVARRLLEKYIIQTQ